MPSMISNRFHGQLAKYIADARNISRIRAAYYGREGCPIRSTILKAKQISAAS